MDQTTLWENLKPYGDLISVCGALIIFFSWVLTNIIGDHLKSAKASAGDARATQRLFTTLYELKVMLEGPAASVIDTSTDILRLAHQERERYDPSRAERDRHWMESTVSVHEIATDESTPTKSTTALLSVTSPFRRPARNVPGTSRRCGRLGKRWPT